MAENPTAHSAARFGMFLGVYTPSVLTMLGLIMYLRFCWMTHLRSLTWHSQSI